MSVNSKAKGCRGERLLAKELQKYGYEAKRMQQFKGSADSPDVSGLPGIHIECKFYREPLNWAQKETFMQQAERDSEGKSRPVVMHKANNKPWEVTMRIYCGRALVTMQLEDFMEIFGAWQKEKA